MRRNTKFHDLTGKRFEKLVCLKQGEFCGNHRTWWCHCDCGNNHRALATNLLSGKTKSCGCLGISCGNKNINWKGYEEISGEYWNNIKMGAKRRSILFSISIEVGWKLFIEQNRKCALSGIPLEFSRNKKEKSKATASLDRIDSSKGYVIGNIQWVHKDINYMKKNFSEEYFKELCKKVTDTCS